MIGKTVAHYHVLAKIGEGGMGVVYRAEDTRLKRTVALKFLRPELLGDRHEKERFVREAQAAAALDHPNICAVHEIEEAGGRTFIVMPFVEGRSLAERVRSGPLPVEESVSIAVQIAEGLQEAHEHGIVHRDIKPGNIMLTQKGSVRITDFGLARLASAAGISMTNRPMGTMRYMSPEQVKGEHVDGRTDIWSLGVLLYRLVTGSEPFSGDYDAAILYTIVHDEPPRPSSVNQSVPQALDGIIKRMLEKKPEQRYASMAEVAADLKRLGRSLQTVRERGVADPGYRPRMVHAKRSTVIFVVLAAAIVGVAAIFAVPSMLDRRARGKAQDKSQAVASHGDSIVSEAERLLRLAVASYPGGNPRQAIDYLEAAVRQDSTLVTAFGRLARIYTYNGDYADALDCAARVKAAALRTGGADAILKADILENWARGEWNQAAQNMRLYLRDFDANDLQVRLELGYVLSRYLKDYDGAIEQLTRFIEIVPPGDARGLGVANNYLGHAYLQLGDFEAATAAYRRAGELMPGDTDIEHSVACVKHFRGDYAGAIREYDKLIVKDPRFFPTYRDLGLAYFETGRWREALESFDRYISRAPASAAPDGYILRGLVHLAQRNAALAGSMADSALARAPGSIKAHWLEGICALRLKSDIAAAGRELGIMDSLRQQPGPSEDHAYFFHLKGSIGLERGELKTGVESLRDAVDVCCRDDCIFFKEELADGCLRAARYDESIREAETVLALNGYDARMRSLLGRAYEGKGMLSTARDHYRRAADVWSAGNEDFVPRRDVLDKLRRL
jgi:tetratricopeptide (TPR) repeat protein/tRNA A-37 threonylcarbamoyl transferase component Bud32